MDFLLIIFLVVCLIIAIAFIIPAEVFFYSDTTSNEMRMNFDWLHIVKAKVSLVNLSPYLSVYLFGLRIYSKPLKTKSHGKLSGMDRFRALELHDSFIVANYAFGNPFYTGIACGIIPLLQSLLNDTQIEEYPDFFSIEDYMKVRAGTKLYLGDSLVHFIQLKNNRPKLALVNT